MGTWSCLLVVLLLLVCSDAWRAQTQRDKIELYTGESAVIPCSYTFIKNPFYWKTEWFVSEPGGGEVRIFHSTPYTQKYDLNTSYSERISVEYYNKGETLIIDEVQLSDEREFVCRVIGYSGGSGNRNIFTAVYDVPEPPVIDVVVQSGVLVSTESLSKIASCKTRGGYPEPSITWYRDHLAIHPANHVADVKAVVTKESSGLYTVRSDLHYNVTREDKDAHFSCEVIYRVPGGFKTLRSNHVNITVHYPTTSVKLQKESPKGLVTEGDTVKMRCHGDGSPPPSVLFSKQQSQAELESYDDGLLVLKEVSRNDSGVYECRSLDHDSAEPGDVMESLELTVHYLDQALLVPKDLEVMQKGGNLTATCNAQSSLDTSVVWRKDGVEVGREDELRLENATFDTAGQYDCVVTTPSAPHLQTNASVRIVVQGAPEIKDAEIKLDWDEIEKAGGWVNVSCGVRGYPKPTITWSIIGSQDWREEITHEAEDQIQSVVTLQVSLDTVAVCRATNDFGSDTKTYDLGSGMVLLNHGEMVFRSEGVRISAHYGPEDVRIEGPGEVSSEESVSLAFSAASEPSASFHCFILVFVSSVFHFVLF